MPRLRRLWLIPVIGLVLVMAAVLLIRCSPPCLTHPPIVILEDQIGGLDDVAPSQGDIDRARAVLGEEGVIAYLNCSLDNVLFASRLRYAREIAEGFWICLEVYDARNDLYTQLTQIQQASLDGAEAIILCPAASSGYDESIATLEANNIPLVWATLVDDIDGVKLDSDNYAIGQRIGEYAGQIFTKNTAGRAITSSFIGHPSPHRCGV